MYKLVAMTRVFNEPFPTLFYSYSPIFEPTGGRSFPSDDIAAAAIAAAALTAPGGNPDHLRQRDLDREMTIWFESNLEIQLQRLELGDVTAFHLSKDGTERLRFLVAPGNLAPGVRVYTFLPELEKSGCEYFLDPGWSVQILTGEGHPPAARIYRIEPGSMPAGTHPSNPKGKRGLRRRGPAPTPDERKLAIITGWDGATGETQESYCNRVGIATSTFRAWKRYLLASGQLPEAKQ